MTRKASPQAKARTAQVGFAAMLFGLVSLGGLAGCGGSILARDAQAGRFEGLDQRVAGKVNQGTMKPGEAVDIAYAIARGEAERAQGLEGAARIRELGSCAKQVNGLLERRAEKDDDVGALAAMIRVDAGLESTGSLSKWVNAPSAAWRAVGARGLVSGDDGALRRKRIADGDEDVRSAALRAATDAADASDEEAVLEAARLDPNPGARRRAILAAGAIGGDRVVLALKDLWPLADETLRQAIAEAWAKPRSLEAGGRRELVWASEHERGSAAIVAAFELSLAKGQGSGEANFVLERAITSGPTKDRALAILLAPYDVEPLREAMKKASDDPDDGVAITALGRRLEMGGPHAPGRAAIVAKLVTYAAGNSPRALLAKAALARNGAREVLPVLTHDMKSTDDQVREAAGVDLALLGELPRAAIIAVDRTPRVRTAVACAILRRAN